nr:unnamed protein product [Callosobruchus analis]
MDYDVYVLTTPTYEKCPIYVNAALERIVNDYIPVRLDKGPNLQEDSFSFCEPANALTMMSSEDEDGKSGSESDHQVNQNVKEREELSRQDESLNKKENKQGRKRTRNEAQWKANKRKKARTSGERYTSSRKTVIRARPSCIDESPVQRHRNRNDTREDILQNFIDHALRKTLAGGTIKGDLRKGHIPQNKIPEEIRQEIRDHINKFPYYESHYSREKTSRKYLECDLSVSKMYQLYHEEAIAANTLPKHIGKLWLYRHIFNAEFNLSFKKPSNDTCDK